MSTKDNGKANVVEEVSDELYSSTEVDESFSKDLQRQSRLLSFLFSKSVPPVPSEDERVLYPANPRNVVQYLFFWWINPLYITGYKRTIEDTDIYKFPEEMKIEHKYLIYSSILNRRISNWKHKNPNKGNKWPVQILLMTLLETFAGRFIVSTIFSLFYIGCITGNPMVTKVLINFVEKRLNNRSTVSIGPGIGYAFLNGLLLLIQLLGFAHTLDIAFKIGIDLKALILKNVFEKYLKLTSQGRKQFPASKVTTLIGSDLARLEFTFSFVNLALAMAVGAIISIALLIHNIGVSALPGIGLMLICCSFQGISSKKLYQYRKDLNEFTDARVGYIRELINSFKTIKFYSWEAPYFDRIKAARTKEMAIVLKMKLLRAVIESASTSLPTLSTMISFLVLYKIKGMSNIAGIFSSLSLFSILGSQIDSLPQFFSSGSDAISALNRAIALLQCEEEEIILENPAPSSLNLAIEVKNASFEWEKLDDRDSSTVLHFKRQQFEEAYELQSIISQTTNSIVPIESILHESFSGFKNLTFSIKKGEFVIVTGLIGSGKSSLLNALAGTMERTSGSLATSGNLLFYDTPWVQNATVRENIIFGSPYDEIRYRKVLFACALLDDIKLLQAGDLTEVGERGVTLSGGQRARINLARAVYADKDVLLLDDVLSAVDAKVGEHIMKHCFLGLLKEKTRVLATHQLSLISLADSVIFLNKDGSISCGLYEVLKNNNSEFSNLLSFNSEIKVHTEVEEKEEEEEEETENLDDELSNGLLMSKEKRLVNHLKWSVYKVFLVSSETGGIGFVLLFLLLISLIFGTFTVQFINVWLSFWTEYKFESLKSSAYMGIYIMFNFINIFFTFGQLSSLSWVVNNASKSLVIGAVRRLLYAPMSFMDTTPAGRILNRFTKDADVLDNEVYQNLLMLFTQITTIVGAFILTVVYLPWIAISIPFLVIVCLCVTDFSQSTGRETKRVDAIRRSSIFDNINEVFDGLSTVKAYGAQQRFMEKNNENLNRNNESQYLSFTSQRWLTLHLTIPSAVYSFLVAVLAATGVFHISASSTGLLLNSVLGVADALGMVFRSFMMIENSMNSAERLHEYSIELEQESPHKIPEFTPSPSWPSDPSIKFDDVSLSYRPELPLVLKNVSFKVNGTEKIGICGRTGAGKSSIMTALYRIVEPRSGKIIIDGLDVKRMGLQDLRSKLTIIPQETVLFKGTIRYNLDPFGQLPDSRLVEALRKSGLLKDGEISKFDLDLLVEDGGVNFSLGEKQLIALARALSRDSNILILDEATSSVDYETDSKIQHTIKNEFSDCTVLCIAHRLRTILDYDKILVMDAGEVREYDTPLNLYNNKESLFREMCESSDITEPDFEN